MLAAAIKATGVVLLSVLNTHKRFCKKVACSVANIQEYIKENVSSKFTNYLS